MATITQSKFDEMLEAFETMQYRCDDWFPSIEEIKEYLEPNIERDYKFALWILETSNEPQTQKKKEARRYLMNLVYNHLSIT